MADPHDGGDPSVHVARSGTCTDCGVPTTVEARAGRPDVRATCVNSGEWAVMVPDPDMRWESAAAIAEAFAGETATEHQLLANLSYEILGTDRGQAATLMDCSASNVDNLHQREREMTVEAKRLVTAIAAIERVDPNLD